MTLKDLRKFKGLNQAECAKYLGMTTRNYQNYENNPEKVGTAKYNAIYQKIESYGVNLDSGDYGKTDYSFNTNVVTGVGLQAFAKSVAKFDKRDCFRNLERFIKESYDGKICILYGLRRTGKTTLLFQMISELPVEQTAYIKAQTTDNMSLLRKDLDKLFKLGYKYVFIDEITLLADFINNAAVLSDIFGMMGMKKTTIFRKYFVFISYFVHVLYVFTNNIQFFGTMPILSLLIYYDIIFSISVNCVATECNLFTIIDDLSVFPKRI